MRAWAYVTILLAACLATSFYIAQEQYSNAQKGGGDHPGATAEGRRPQIGAAAGLNEHWSGKAAGNYLDSRLTWWMGWPVASRDHNTFCVSCHTVLPYALGRPALRADLQEQAPSPNERRLIDNVTKRVRMWKEVEPYYSDEKRGAPKTTESRGTESVLNALVLVTYDAPSGRLGSDARLAFDNMWAQQLKTGAARGTWAWLEFGNQPWEGSSQYFGATLAAIAVGRAPANYQSAPEMQDGMKILRDYLVRERASQVLVNRVMVLWASTKFPGLLTPDQQKALIDEVLSKQHEDGGFSLSAFVGDWKRKDGTPLETRSDGFATGLVAFALEQAGLPPDQPQLQRALAWLASHQERSEGRWLAYSVNQQHHLSAETGRFMSDAATAYAVLALKGARK